MLTQEQVEAIIRSAVAPIEAELREIKDAVLAREEPASRSQVESIVEETLTIALEPVLQGLADLGAPRRRIETPRSRASAKAVDEVMGSARRAMAAREGTPARSSRRTARIGDCCGADEVEDQVRRGRVPVTAP